VLGVVDGRVPEWLRGSLYRNGPGLFQAGQQDLDHLFDGYSLVNKFQFEDGGRVTWRAAFLESDAYEAAKNGAMRFHEFGTSAGSDLWTKLVGIARAISGEVTDNAAVSIQRLDDGTMLAVTESVRGTFEFDPKTLKTGDRLKWLGDDVGQLNTAHPLPDGSGP
jgi:carotenoid cleavage dioxygenase-like enzyme